MLAWACLLTQQTPSLPPSTCLLFPGRARADWLLLAENLGKSFADGEGDRLGCYSGEQPQQEEKGGLAEAGLTASAGTLVAQWPRLPKQAGSDGRLVLSRCDALLQRSALCLHPKWVVVAEG